MNQESITWRAVVIEDPDKLNLGWLMEVLVVLTRLCAACAFTLLFLAVAITSADAQATSQLTVHARYCDPGVVPEDPFEECHDNPLDQWGVHVDGPEPIGETDAQGNFSLDGLGAGNYVLYVQAPLNATTFRIYCTVAGGDGTFLDLTPSGNGMSIPVAAGVEVICDWYWLISDEPAGDTAPLTIHARICPTDQVPADFFASCHDDPIANLEFFGDGTSLGSTGADGNLVANVDTGTVSLGGGVPGEFARNFVYCSDASTTNTVLEFTEVSGEVDLDVSATGVICDWYAVPFDLKGDDPTPTPTDDDEVTQLPNTGLGSSDGSSALPVLMAVVAILIAATGLVVRRERI